MTTTERLLAGIDVGGSKIAVLVTDDELRPRGRHLAATQVGAPAGAADQIVAALDAALADAAGDRRNLAALGVGVPGRVDRVTGIVSHAVNLGWERLELGALLEACLGRPVVVENDVRAAVAGLHERRVLGDVDDIAYLSIGTGISAGLVLDGRVRRGPRGIAGEIGHVVLDPDGPRCSCGLHGCLESLASGPAIAARARAGLAAGRRSALETVDPVTAIEVFRHAAAGDVLAIEIVEAVGGWVARAVHELVMTFDVRRVALGGGVASGGQAFRAPIDRGLDRLRDASSLARAVLTDDVVAVLGAEAEAGPWGAVLLARDALRGWPDASREEEVAHA